MNDLWCIHVAGPDTVIPQPDKDTAVRRASEWNAQMSDRAQALICCRAMPWPYSRESHAASLAKHGGQPEDIC